MILIRLLRKVGKVAPMCRSSPGGVEARGGDVIIYVLRYIFIVHTGGTDLCYDQFHQRALEVERHRR